MNQCATEGDAETKLTIEQTKPIGRLKSAEEIADAVFWSVSAW
jgi:hypothetical protein